MLLALVLMQDVFERADREFRPFAATLRVERAERRGDATSVLTARFELEADRALTVEGRGVRAEDLPGLDVWRRPWSALAADYAIEVRAAEPDAAPLPSVRIRPGKGPAWAAGEPPARRVLLLTPKSGGPKLTVWFDDALLRAERVAWDTRTHAVALTLGDGGGAAPKVGGAPRKRGVDAEERR
jgi:hypothetical protein